MKKIQKLIDQMHAGNTNTIINNIFSDIPIIVMNAIMAGTKVGLTDPLFLEGVRNAEKNDAVLLGVPISKVATASLHLLTDKKYSGDDIFIRKLIESEFIL